jgi:adrenodoxin-NADP+ reductase
VGIVGSGPAAFYAAKYLLSANSDVHVDIFERLPSPFGLVRYGVAPDHQDVKSVATQFADLVNSSKRMRYFGNVPIGHDSKTSISVQTLQKYYSAVILAYGASEDADLCIPNEDCSISARNFVNFYNGHPEFDDYAPKFPLDNIENVVIIGNGNVAIDCARILATSVDELRSTDITDNALNLLAASNVKNIHVIGRRGHAQASFTIKEMRELTRLNGTRFHILESDLIAGRTPSSLQEIAEARPKKRLMELLETVAASPPSLPHSTTKHIYARFLMKPVEIQVEVEGGERRPTGVVFEKTRLEGPPFQQSAVGTGEYIVIPCQLVLKSVGYRSVPITGVPFDYSKNIIPSVGGRVVVPTDAGETGGGARVPGLYVTGWIKRGPTGIILTNIVDAKETVAAVVHDLAVSGLLSPTDVPATTDPMTCIPQMSEDTVVTWRDFLNAELEETKRGSARHPAKVREKIVDVDEFLGFVRAKR